MPERRPEMPATRAEVSTTPLVLLCYKKRRRQQGHLGRERARWVAIWRRRVAMEWDYAVRSASAAPRGVELGAQAG